MRELFCFYSSADDQKACLVKSVTSLYLAKSHACFVAICMQNHRAGNSVYIQAAVCKYMSQARACGRDSMTRPFHVSCDHSVI